MNVNAVRDKTDLDCSNHKLEAFVHACNAVDDMLASMGIDSSAIAEDTRSWDEIYAEAMDFRWQEKELAR